MVLGEAWRRAEADSGELNRGCSGSSCQTYLIKPGLPAFQLRSIRRLASFSTILMHTMELREVATLATVVKNGWKLCRRPRIRVQRRSFFPPLVGLAAARRTGQPAE